MMAEESVLAKLFQENSAIDNPYLQQVLTHNIAPIMEQLIFESFMEEDDNENNDNGDNDNEGSNNEDSDDKDNDDEDNDNEDSNDDGHEDVIIIRLDESIQQMVHRRIQYVLQQSQHSIAAVRMGLTQAKLLNECEIMIKKELVNNGIKRVEKSVLESEKLKLLSQRIKSGDKDALLFVHYYGQFMCELYQGTPVDYEEYVKLVEEMKHSLPKLLEIMSQNQRNLAALMNVSQSVDNYYLEEVCTTLPMDAVISYDPLFSLPKGNVACMAHTGHVLM